MPVQVLTPQEFFSNGSYSIYSAKPGSMAELDLQFKFAVEAGTITKTSYGPGCLLIIENDSAIVKKNGCVLFVFDTPTLRFGNSALIGRMTGKADPCFVVKNVPLRGSVGLAISSHASNPLAMETAVKRAEFLNRGNVSKIIAVLSDCNYTKGGLDEVEVTEAGSVIYKTAAKMMPSCSGFAKVSQHPEIDWWLLTTDTTLFHAKLNIANFDVSVNPLALLSSDIPNGLYSKEYALFLESMVSDRRKTFESLERPAGRPIIRLPAPIRDGRITDRYGRRRRAAKDSSLGVVRFHREDDIEGSGKKFGI